MTSMSHVDHIRLSEHAVQSSPQLRWIYSRHRSSAGLLSLSNAALHREPQEKNLLSFDASMLPDMAV